MVNRYWEVVDTKGIFSPAPALQPQAVPPALCAQLNAAAAPYGLALSEAQTAALWQSRTDALARSGRVEFGESVLPKLVAAFCGSPYLDRRSFADALAQLLELFYLYKGECGERLADDALLAAMRRAFDGPAGGSLDALAALDPKALGEASRPGGSFAAETENDETAL